LRLALPPANAEILRVSSSDTLRMTGFATWARGHHPHLLKTPKIKVTEKANKKQTLISP
jgi:hypothetical protein